MKNWVGTGSLSFLFCYLERLMKSLVYLPIYIILYYIVLYYIIQTIITSLNVDEKDSGINDVDPAPPSRNESNDDDLYITSKEWLKR